MDANEVKKRVEHIRSELGVIEFQIRAVADYSKVEVTLFKPSGKYYTTDFWRVPDGAIGPYDMERSPDFRRIDGGAVLIPSQEPWGFPVLFPGQTDSDKALAELVRLKDGPRDEAYEAAKPEAWEDARRALRNGVRQQR